MMSEEEIKQHYQRKLGEEFGAVYDGLWKYWSHGWVRLNEIRNLFGNAEQVELLNAITSGAFLWDIQQVLLDDLMLCVTRLTDPPSMQGGENLTVKRIPQFLKQEPHFRKKVTRLIEGAVKLAAPAREYRNKRVGHIDMESIRNPKKKPLPRATLDEVQKALDAIHEILNRISLTRLRENVANEVVIKPRALAFAANARHLARHVQFLDSLIDPTGCTKFTDTDVATDFLKKTGLPPTTENIRQVIELRESANLFNTDRQYCA